MLGSVCQVDGTISEMPGRDVTDPTVLRILDRDAAPGMVFIRVVVPVADAFIVTRVQGQRLDTAFADPLPTAFA